MFLALPLESSVRPIPRLSVGGPPVTSESLGRGGDHWSPSNGGPRSQSNGRFTLVIILGETEDEGFTTVRQRDPNSGRTRVPRGRDSVRTEERSRAFEEERRRRATVDKTQRRERLHRREPRNLRRLTGGDPEGGSAAGHPNGVAPCRRSGLSYPTSRASGWVWLDRPRQ